MEYEGETHNGLANGKGVLRGNGFNLVGMFKDGVIEGFGIITQPNGNCYEGEFKDGIPNGNGFWIGDNYKFEGLFKNGQPNGFGELNDVGSNNLKFKGRVENGKIDGQSEIIFKNKCHFSGNYK